MRVYSLLQVWQAVIVTLMIPLTLCSPLSHRVPVTGQTVVNTTVDTVVVGDNVTQQIVHALTNINGSLAHVYDLKDSTGFQMASLHLIEADPSSAVYHGIYMTLVSTQWEVRVATSTDLMTWTYRSTISSSWRPPTNTTQESNRLLSPLLPNADMPYACVVQPNGWIVVVHEQWMNPGSRLPSQLGFKLYYNLTQLLAGTHFNSYIAPLSVGAHSQLEGTPNIYNATLVFRNGYDMIDASIGFHYNDAHGVDQVAQGFLQSFGPTAVQPSWQAQAATAYNQVFIRDGAIGNIGQRDAGVLAGRTVVVQEANIGKMPPTIWADWRIWLYTPAMNEGLPPTGAGSALMLQPQTDKGSFAFGNPSFKLVRCPPTANVQAANISTDASHVGDEMCIFVSYFAFSEGAQPGEAGVVAFYNKAPTLYEYS
eukprot:m.124399 g.124399  ORF g.124399 m.124399 type:complete len:424 (-) comp29059_c0_seq1:105-1376(-)